LDRGRVVAVLGAKKGASARRLLPVLALLGLGVLAAACSSTPSTLGVASLGSSTTQAGATAGGAATGGSAVAVGGVQSANGARFAHCMQTHGVPGFALGAAGAVNSGSRIDKNSGQFQQALTKCRSLLPNGGVPTPQQQQKLLASALKFSQCMRSHGLTDFPDPQVLPGGRGIGLRVRGGPNSDIDPSSPKFQAAAQACQKVLPFRGKFGVRARG